MLLPLTDVKHISVPHYPEMNIKHLFSHYKDDESLSKYLPSKFAKGRQVDRTFFFNVFNTIYPKELAKMISNART